MATQLLDIYLDDVNKNYLNKLTFQVLFKSRSLGYHCAADMFCDAYKEYNDKISEEGLHAIKTFLISQNIISKYQIAYKSDLIYLVRHPNLFRYEIDEKQKPVRKKVLQFFNLDDPDMPHKREAYEFLKSNRPVKRAGLIDTILEQYLTLSHNKYFIDQASARLIKDLIENAEFDDEGNILTTGKSLIDVIWAAGNAEKISPER